MSTKRDDTLRSWILLLAGLAGIGYQQYTGETSILLLLIYTLMAGVPGVAGIISLIKTSPTVLQLSSLQPQPLESDLEKSSQKSLEGKDEKGEA